jgi:predicted transcriptional regulator
MDKLADRFITVYNEIDKWLRKIVKADGRVTFASLVDAVSDPKKCPHRHNSVVACYARDLKEFGDLRNAIVHHYRDDEIIATPHAKAVKELEAIRDRLLNPPHVHPLFARDVLQCCPEDPVGAVARQMRKKKFSQVPVYSETLLFALLTTDTIARWVACFLGNDQRIMEEAPVKEVLNQAEFTDNFQLLAPDAPVVDAIDRFDHYMRAGRRLDAILITEGGKKTNTPMGIISVSDIPKLHAALE